MHVTMGDNNIQSAAAGATVLQRLLAEHYRSNGDNSHHSNNNGSSQSLGKEEFKINSGESDVHHLQHPPSPLPRKKPNPLPRTNPDPASRLDALCRSTLEKPDENPNKSSDSQNSSYTNPPPPQYLNPAELTEPTAAHRRYSSSNQQDYMNNNNGPMEAQKPDIVTRSTPSLANGLVSPRIDATGLDDRYQQQRNISPNKSNGEDVKRRPQMSGHLKSRSGGDDYLYTDYMSKQQQQHRPCIRNNRIRKNNHSAVERSNSLHQRKHVVAAGSNTSADSTFSQPIRTTLLSEVEHHQSSHLYRSSPMLDHSLVIPPPTTLERSRKRLSYGSSYSVPDITNSDVITTTHQVCCTLSVIFICNFECADFSLH